MTVVNDYGVAYICQSLPFGGVRISGFGRINGREGLRECCVTHAVLTDRYMPLSVCLFLYHLFAYVCMCVCACVGSKGSV